MEYLYQFVVNRLLKNEYRINFFYKNEGRNNSFSLKVSINKRVFLISILWSKKYDEYTNKERAGGKNNRFSLSNKASVNKYKFLKEYRGIFWSRKYDKYIISKGCVEGRNNRFSLSNKVSINKYKCWIFEGISRIFWSRKYDEYIMSKKCIEGIDFHCRTKCR